MPSPFLLVSLEPQVVSLDSPCAPPALRIASADAFGLEDRDGQREAIAFLREQFAQRLREIGTEDLGRAILETAIQNAHATELRPGVCFVPRDHIDQWRHVESVLRSLGGFVFHDMEIHRSESSASTIGAAVNAQLSGTLDEILAAINDKEMGHRALAGTALRLADIERQLGVYEALLASDKPLQESLLNLRARLSTALLIAETRKDGEPG